MSARTLAYIEAAIAWANDHLGSTEYKFLCYGFLEDAYEKANGILLDGKGTNACEAASAYGVRAGDPTRGSYVFFHCRGSIDGVEKDYGHIGLALGDGRVIHAWDQVRIDEIPQIEQLEPAPGWTQPAYLGWAPADQILTGARINL
jgi:cell wall-associated NlpC family hydrolase